MKNCLLSCLCAFWVALSPATAQTSSNPASPNVLAPVVSDPLLLFPEAGDGLQRTVLRLPAKSNEAHYRVELMVGKTVLVDACNQHFIGGSYNVRQVEGFGYDYYLVESEGVVGGTLMSCTDTFRKAKFVWIIQDNLIHYSSRGPLVIYAPKGFEVRYRIWSAGKTQVTSQPAVVTKGIRDCPEERVVNRLPSSGSRTTPDEYYIYKGTRHELAEFDMDWLRKHCRIKVSAVQ